MENTQHKQVPVPNAGLDTSEPFMIMTALWCESNKLPRRRYSDLRRILLLLNDVEPIRKLPKTLSLLLSKCKSRFPAVQVDQQEIPTVTKKLPTMSEPEKSADIAASNVKIIPMFFINPIDLVTRLVRSPTFLGELYQGIGKFVDNPIELWHGDAWTTSIKATSGQFAEYPDRSGPIFPSDVVCYRSPECQLHAVGQVQMIGIDERENSPTQGEVMLGLKKIATNAAQLRHLGLMSDALEPPFENRELILIDGNIVFISPSQVLNHMNIFRDYEYPENKNLKLNGTNLFFIRRVLLQDHLIRPIVPLSSTTPTRGELEILTHGRQVLVDKYFKKKCISIPYMLFSDGFGLYRNMYRSLMGVYLIPAGFSSSARSKQSGVFPITLGPHGSEFSEVISRIAKGGLSDLDEGTEIHLNGEKILLTVHGLAFLGDMPQQNMNAGSMSPTAKSSCRQCNVTANEHCNINVDTVLRGRYHFDLRKQRRKMEQIPTKAATDRFRRTHGFSTHQPLMSVICPSLDSVASFPSDPCHSEFAGITRMSHTLLIEAILSTKGQDEYTAAFQNFPFPSGWKRIQSPIHHLNSFQIQEFARASILTPLILRTFMRPHWISDAFLSAIAIIFGKDTSPIDLIVRAYVEIARSNSILACRTVAPESRLCMKKVVVSARSQLMDLLETAAVASDDCSRKRPEFCCLFHCSI